MVAQLPTKKSGRLKKKPITELVFLVALIALPVMLLAINQVTNTNSKAMQNRGDPCYPEKCGKYRDGSKLLGNGDLEFEDGTILVCEGKIPSECTENPVRVIKADKPKVRWWNPFDWVQLLFD